MAVEKLGFCRFRGIYGASTGFTAQFNAAFFWC
jgi:hypothetical protein